MSPGTFFAIWIPTMVIGWAIGNRKGHPVTGVVLTAALGIIGLIILLFVPTSTDRKIEHAAERQRIEEAARASRLER